MIEYFLYFLTAFVVYLNILASVSLLKSNDLSVFQKVSQLMFVWLIPIIGSKLVLNMLSEAEPESTEWVPRMAHGWLIIGSVYHDSLHGRDDSSPTDISSGSDGGSSD